METVLNIKRLPTVEEINASLDFLDHSTQKRNTCELILLKEFQVEILSKYPIYGGLRKLIEYDLLRINSDIIEGLLFCALQKLGKAARGRNSGAAHYVNFAAGQNLISRTTKKRAEIIVEHRNDLHADKQIFLLLQIDNQVLDISSKIVEEVVGDLKKFFIKEISQDNVVLTRNIDCMYCIYGYTEYGELCRACGGIGFESNSYKEVDEI